jgi:hypothetical protein
MHRALQSNKYIVITKKNPEIFIFNQRDTIKIETAEGWYGQFKQTLMYFHHNLLIYIYAIKSI